VAGQRSLGRRLVTQVGNERRCAARSFRIAAAIQDEELQAVLHGEAGAGAADQTGATDE
jgi:hypothetical protein